MNKIDDFEAERKKRDEIKGYRAELTFANQEREDLLDKLDRAFGGPSLDDLDTTIANVVAQHRVCLHYRTRLVKLGDAI